MVILTDAVGAKVGWRTKRPQTEFGGGEGWLAKRSEGYPLVCHIIDINLLNENLSQLKSLI